MRSNIVNVSAMSRFYSRIYVLRLGSHCCLFKRKMQARSKCLLLTLTCILLTVTVIVSLDYLLTQINSFSLYNMNVLKLIEKIK